MAALRSYSPLKTAHQAPQASPDFPTYLLPQTHNLEALEVVQRLSPRCLLHLLRVRASSPLGVNIGRLPLLLQGCGSGSSWELGNDDIGERQALESSGVTWDSERLDG